MHRRPSSIRPPGGLAAYGLMAVVACSPPFQRLDTEVTRCGGRCTTFLEAESGDVTANMTVVSDDTASGGAHILDGNVQGQPGPGRVTLTFELTTETADYVVWARVIATDNARDSFDLTVDGDGPQEFFLGREGYSPEWRWTYASICCPAEVRLYSLDAGTHSLVLDAREGQSVIDRLLVTSDRTYVPAD